MPTHSIRVRTPHGGYEQADLVTETEADGYTLRIHLGELGDVTSSAGDLFECLAQVRRQVDPKGLRLLVNGARRDTWASGMSRSMGGGREAYVLQLGRPSQMEHLVNIFDPAPESEIASVDQQQAFMREWMESISSSRGSGT